MPTGGVSTSFDLKVTGIERLKALNTQASKYEELMTKLVIKEESMEKAAIKMRENYEKTNVTLRKRNELYRVAAQTMSDFDARTSDFLTLKQITYLEQERLAMKSQNAAYRENIEFIKIRAQLLNDADKKAIEMKADELRKYDLEAVKIFELREQRKAMAQETYEQIDKLQEKERIAQHSIEIKLGSAEKELKAIEKTTAAQDKSLKKMQERMRLDDERIKQIEKNHAVSQKNMRIAKRTNTRRINRMKKETAQFQKLNEEGAEYIADIKRGMAEKKKEEAQLKKINKLLERNAMLKYKKPVQMRGIVAKDHKERMARSQQLVDYYERENQALTLNTKKKGLNRQAMMQLSISYFVFLITLRAVVEEMKKYTKAGTVAGEMVNALGETLVKVMPAVQLFTALTNMAVMRMTALSAAVAGVGIGLLAIVFLYKAVTAKTREAKIALGLLSGAFMVVTAALFTYTLQQMAANSQLVLALALSENYAAIAAAFIVTFAAMAAMSAGTVALVSTQQDFFKKVASEGIPGFQTMPGESRLIKSGGIYRGHAGEVISRPAEGTSPIDMASKIVINVEAGAYVDERLMEQLGNQVARRIR